MAEGAPKELTSRDSIKLLSMLLARVAVEGNDNEAEVFARAIDNIDLPDNLLSKFMDPKWRNL